MQEKAAAERTEREYKEMRRNDANTRLRCRRAFMGLQDFCTTLSYIMQNGRHLNCALLRRTCLKAERTGVERSVRLESEAPLYIEDR